MEWFKLESRYADDRAVVAAGEKAEVLFVRAIAYSTDFETKGFVPSHQLVRFGLSGVKARADALVREGLWEVVGGGWRIRSYERLQAEALAVMRRREADKERKRQARLNGKSADVSADAGEDESTGHSAACPQNRIYEEEEKELNPLPPSDKAPRRKPKTPCPDFFPVTDDLRAWAAEHASNVTDLEAETRKFLAHHRSVDSLFSRWEQAWRKWMTTAEQYAKQRRPQNSRFDSSGTYTAWDA